MVGIGKPGKRFAILGAGSVALVLLAVAGLGWYYSSLLHSGGLTPDYSPQELTLRVVSVEDDRIVLAEREGEEVDELQDDELWGLEGENGYGQVGAILQVEEGRVTRDFTLLSGSIGEGDFARLDSFAFDGDPLSARGLQYRDVAVPSPLGAMPAWRLDGDPEAWAILVHGWRSEREEALRILPTLSDLRLTSLVITYRNDEEAPRSSDGLIRWGATEWEDLDAAVRYAESEGAQSIVLYGYSMGGGIVMRFLQQSSNADLVAGAILDAPVLDFRTLLDFQAEERGVPGVVASLGLWFAEQRFDLDLDAMDHLEHLDRLTAPILLFHGDDDERAPIETSEHLARERSDIVTYYVVEGARHVRAWNLDPALYEQRVSEFLIDEAGVATPGP